MKHNKIYNQDIFIPNSQIIDMPYLIAERYKYKIEKNKKFEKLSKQLFKKVKLKRQREKRIKKLNRILNEKNK